MGEVVKWNRRLNSILFPFNTKFPILFHANSHFTEIIEWHFHIYYHFEVLEPHMLVLWKFNFTRLWQTMKIVCPCVFCKCPQVVHFLSTLRWALHSLFGREQTLYSHQSRPYRLLQCEMKSCNHQVLHNLLVLFTYSVTRSAHLELVFTNIAVFLENST